jgi:V/A-type H+/Na+-transporting ATPase subunit D
MQKKAEPTKANLIRLRREAALAKQGLEILDRKREILMRELSQSITAYETQYKELGELLRTLYQWNKETLAAIGPRAAEYESIPIKGLVIRAEEKRVMGVRIPSLSIESINIHPHILSPQTNAIAKDLAQSTEKILSFIEISCTMRRIAFETAKTQKREKAIEEIHLPLYKREITRISESLDENEREELVRYKALKRRLSR